MNRLYEIFKESLVFGSVANTQLDLFQEYHVFEPGILVLPDDCQPIRCAQGIDQARGGNQEGQQHIIDFLQHFSFRPGVVTRLDDFSMEYYLGHRAPRQGPLTMLFTEWDQIPPLYAELATHFTDYLFTITHQIKLPSTSSRDFLKIWNI